MTMNVTLVLSAGHEPAGILNKKNGGWSWTKPSGAIVLYSAASTLHEIAGDIAALYKISHRQVLLRNVE